mmetsp:Transcript_2492/g.6717  ORF Transcript_2492/g.6717 Transcript_2492/m.6717 type:complete len:130 (-) Transcript_2492:232-621(-)
MAVRRSRAAPRTLALALPLAIALIYGAIAALHGSRPLPMLEASVPGNLGQRLRPMEPFNAGAAEESAEEVRLSGGVAEAMKATRQLGSEWRAFRASRREAYDARVRQDRAIYGRELEGLAAGSSTTSIV